VPNFDDIDRAYKRSKPSPRSGLDGYKTFVTRSTALSALFVVAVSICFAMSVAADQILGLYWGYQWRDFWAALGLATFDLFVWDCVARGSPSPASMTEATNATLTTARGHPSLTAIR
jgi:hypothetical protein